MNPEVVSGGDRTLSKETYEEIVGCLSELLEQLRIPCVMVITSTGRILAYKASSESMPDPGIMATLAANAYLAAGEMASLLREPTHFKMMLFEGERHNLFVSSIGGDSYLVIVFGVQVALGLVRLYAKKTVKRLFPLLNQEVPEALDTLFDSHFQALLGDALDKTLGDETIVR